MTKGITMFISTYSSQPQVRRFGLARFAEWWPAAIVGLLALIGDAPGSNAQSLLTLL